jgi:nicotinate-nucleotide pyrophosphorylase (carboxylating)
LAVTDGDPVAANALLGEVRGEVAAILRAERPMLNLLQRACGIATMTRRFVKAISGTPCRVLHTRKTAPGLRVFDVAAVIAGGGHVHRLGLDQIVMIKDNHWEALGVQGKELGGAVEEARRRGVPAVQVEVESAAQVEAACQAGADRLLIDNRSPAEFRQLVDLARQREPVIEIEATGGITLDNVRAYAEAGADFVSIGALTHSVQAVDLTLEV